MGPKPAAPRTREAVGDGNKGAIPKEGDAWEEDQFWETKSGHEAAKPPGRLEVSNKEGHFDPVTASFWYWGIGLDSPRESAPQGEDRKRKEVEKALSVAEGWPRRCDERKSRWIERCTCDGLHSPLNRYRHQKKRWPCWAGNQQLRVASTCSCEHASARLPLIEAERFAESFRKLAQSGDLQKNMNQ